MKCDTFMKSGTFHEFGRVLRFRLQQEKGFPVIDTILLDFSIFNLNIVILVEWDLTRNLVEYLLDYPYLAYPYLAYPYLDYPDTKRRSMITFTD